jgi:hypothetical protein
MNAPVSFTQAFKNILENPIFFYKPVNKPYQPFIN